MDILSTKIPFINVPIANIVFAGITIVVGYILAVALARYTRRAILRAKMTKILAGLTARVVKILIIIFALATAISFFGVDVGAAVLSLAVVSGFVIGFAFQDTLGNLAGGFMIAITKPFRQGDYVEIAGNSGSVKSVGASITTLITYDNRKIVIPNSEIWGSPIINYTAMDKRMIDLTIGIGYGDDIGKAMEIAMDLIGKHENVLDDPAPMVAVNNLGDSSVDLIVRPWTKTADYWSTRRELTRQIKEAYDETGINIPFPQHDVHLFEENK